MASFLATLFVQLIRTNFKVAHTQAEALELIEQLEGKMPVPVPSENPA
jgi:hypothetical protein